jgi:hypothetical protein
MLALGPAAIRLAAMVGYLYGVESVYPIALCTGMAKPTTRRVLTQKVRSILDQAKARV